MLKTLSEATLPQATQANRPGLVDLPVLLVAACALLGVLLYRQYSVAPARDVHALEDALEVWLPAGWAKSEDAGVFVAQPPSLGAYVPTLTVQRLVRPQDIDAANFAETELARMLDQRTGARENFRVLETSDRTALGGHQTYWTKYAVVRDPPGSPPGAAVLPVVLMGVDVLVLTKERAYRVVAMAPINAFSDQEGDLARVLKSVKFSR